MVLANNLIHDIRRATVFWPFSCVLQCFLHSWASKISIFFFAVFLKYAGFSTFLRAFFSIAKNSHLDWTVSFKTLAVFWNKQAPVFSHLHCQRTESWLTTQATGRYYTSPQPPPKNPPKHPPSRGAVTKNMPWGVKSKQWMNQYLLADEAYGWKTFLANHYC